MSDAAMDDVQSSDLVLLTSEIVAAHVAGNTVPINDVATLIASVHATLRGLGRPVAAEPVEEARKPAVPVRQSVKPDHIVCLEDGKKLVMLKRYLRMTFGLTPDQYRARWNLPKDYPMVAPAYAEKRRTLANEIGLGRRKAVEVPPPAPEKKARKPRARKA